MIFLGLFQLREVPASGTRDAFSFHSVHFASLGTSQSPSATQFPHLFTEGMMLYKHSKSTKRMMLRNTASATARISTVLQTKRFLFPFCTGNNTQ